MPGPRGRTEEAFPLLFLPGEAPGTPPSAGPRGGDTHSPPGTAAGAGRSPAATFQRR